MSWQAVEAVLNKSKSQDAARCVMIAIAADADDQGISGPGLDRIARRAAISRRWTIQLIQQCEAAGELEVRRGGHRTSVYRIKLFAAEIALPAVHPRRERSITPAVKEPCTRGEVASSPDPRSGDPKINSAGPKSVFQNSNQKAETERPGVPPVSTCGHPQCSRHHTCRELPHEPNPFTEMLTYLERRHGMRGQCADPPAAQPRQAQRSPP